jgi:hypothetical protein
MPSSQPSSDRSSQNLETIFYCTPPSPAKPLPMLSSCADYTTSSQHSQSDNHMVLFPPTMDFFGTNPPSRSTSVPSFTCTSSPPMIMLSPENNSRAAYPNDDLFTLHFHPATEGNILVKTANDQLLIDLTSEEPTSDIVVSPQTISNASSPSKHRVLNTPERLVQVCLHFDSAVES